MARGNYFKPSWHGYRYVMNSHNDVMTACEIRAGAIAGFASGLSGIDYMVDSQVGMNRVHTRVSTVTNADFYRERHYHALSIALGANGGHPSTRAYGGSRSKRKKFSNVHKKRYKRFRG